jgi:hypothetical protein
MERQQQWMQAAFRSSGLDRYPTQTQAAHREIEILPNSLFAAWAR